MNRTKMLVAAAGTALVGAAAMFSTASSAGNVAWSLSVGAPGVAVTAGQPAYFGAPYYRPYYAPARVVYRPYHHPYRVYVPAPVVYAPPVVVAPVPYYAPVAPY